MHSGAPPTESVSIPVVYCACEIIPRTVKYIVKQTMPANQKTIRNRGNRKFAREENPNAPAGMIPYTTAGGRDEG